MGLQAAWSPGEGAPSLPSLTVPLHQCAPRHCAGHPAVTWTDTVLCPYGADGPVREQVIHRSKIISKRGHAVKGLHGDERATGKPLRWGVRLGPSVKATSELKQEGGASRGGGGGRRSSRDQSQLRERAGGGRLGLWGEGLETAGRPPRDGGHPVLRRLPSPPRPHAAPAGKTRGCGLPPAVAGPWLGGAQEPPLSAAFLGCRTGFSTSCLRSGTKAPTSP